MQRDAEHDADMLAWFEACRIAVRTVFESQACVGHDQMTAECA